MHASKQSRNMKEYYEQNPMTGEQMGEGVAVPGSDWCAAHNILLVDVGRRVPVRPLHLIRGPAVRPA